MQGTPMLHAPPQQEGKPAYTSHLHLEALCAIIAVLDSIMLCTMI